MDNQICCLRELVMAKQAYDRSLREFLQACNLAETTENLEAAIAQLAEYDAREIDADSVRSVL